MIGTVVAFVVVAVMTKGFKRTGDLLLVGLVAMTVVALVNLVVTGSVFG